MNVLRMNGSNIIPGGRSILDLSQYKVYMVNSSDIENDKPVVVGAVGPKRNPNLRIEIPQKSTVAGSNRRMSAPAAMSRRRCRLSAPVEAPHKRCPIHVGKMYELDDGRFGLCMYFGKTLFNKKGLWVGLQLENAEGKHNGSVHGKKYFLCREGRGVFVRPGRIKRLVTEVTKSNINPHDKKVTLDPRRGRYLRKQTIMDLVNITAPNFSMRELKEIERRESHRRRRMSEQSERSSEDKSENSAWEPAEYGMTPDHGLSFKPKNFYTEKELHSHDSYERESKPRVAEIMEEGFPEEWQEARYDSLSDLTDQRGLYYPLSKLHKHLNEKAERKPGAIETGYADKYCKPEYSGMKSWIDECQYSLHYPISKLHKHDGEHVERKPGAIETGKSDYKIAQYDVDTSIEKRQYALYHPIYELHKRDGEQIPHKEWAREIGMAEGYHQATYSVDWDPISLAQYGLFYNPKEVQRNWTKRNRRDSNVSSIKEGKRYDGDNNGTWNQTAKTPKAEETCSSSLSSKGSTAAWEYASTMGPDSVLVMSQMTPSTECNTVNGGVTPEVVSEMEDDNRDPVELLSRAADEEVNAYIPKRFLRTAPKTRMIRPGDISRRHNTMLVWPGHKGFKPNFRHKTSEDDIFMKDILALAEGKMGERHRKVSFSQKDTGEDFFIKDVLNLAHHKMGERRKRERCRTLSRSLAIPLYDITPLGSEEKSMVV